MRRKWFFDGELEFKAGRSSVNALGFQSRGPCYSNLVDLGDSCMLFLGMVKPNRQKIPNELSNLGWCSTPLREDRELHAKS